MRNLRQSLVSTSRSTVKVRSWDHISYYLPSYLHIGVLGFFSFHIMIIVDFFLKNNHKILWSSCVVLNPEKVMGKFRVNQFC